MSWSTNSSSYENCGNHNNACLPSCLRVVTPPLPRGINPAPSSFGCRDGALRYRGRTESAERETSNNNNNNNKENGNCVSCKLPCCNLMLLASVKKIGGIHHALGSRRCVDLSIRETGVYVQVRQLVSLRLPADVASVAQR